MRGSTKRCTFLPLTVADGDGWGWDKRASLYAPARDAALVSARETMMPAIFLRYSAGPRPSEAGRAMASAAAAACFSVAASSVEPTAMRRCLFGKQRHVGQIGEGDRAGATRPSCSVRTTAAAAVA